MIAFFEMSCIFSLWIVAITSLEIRVLMRARKRGESIPVRYFIWGGLVIEQLFRSKGDEE